MKKYLLTKEEIRDVRITRKDVFLSVGHGRYFFDCTREDGLTFDYANYKVAKQWEEEMNVDSLPTRNTLLEGYKRAHAIRMAIIRSAKFEAKYQVYHITPPNFPVTLSNTGAFNLIEDEIKKSWLIHEGKIPEVTDEYSYLQSLLSKLLKEEDLTNFNKWIQDTLDVRLKPFIRISILRIIGRAFLNTRHGVEKNGQYHYSMFTIIPFQKHDTLKVGQVRIEAFRTKWLNNYPI